MRGPVPSVCFRCRHRIDAVNVWCGNEAVPVERPFARRRPNLIVSSDDTCRYFSPTLKERIVMAFRTWRVHWFLGERARPRYRGSRTRKTQAPDR